MSFPALIGFAGVLVAAVATGLLAGRAVRRPRLDTILWTAATLALTVALAAQSMGFASGFGSATFRAVQLFALLLAPLWLAWGLAELTWPSEAARFGARLACGAVTVVGSVILVTDPLTAEPFGKSWPLAGSHYGPPSHYALDAAQAAAVILVAASLGLAVARARSDGPWPGAAPGTAVVGLAVFLAIGSRFSLPVRSAYPLLSLLAAALIWFGATRLEAQPGLAASGRAMAGRARGRNRAGRDRNGRNQAGRDQADRNQADRNRDGHDQAGRERADRPEELSVTNGHRGPRADDPRPPGDPRGSGSPPPWAEGGRRPPAAPRPELPAAPPYGRILIFTLLDDRHADFDRLAEQAAEEVRTREPDTLVYVIHLVPNAPMQRIFYEIYRDRAAFDTHENQPYMKRFVADRRACVLATNVIELRLKYAKVAPLPSPQPAAPAAPATPRAPLPPGQFPPGHFSPAQPSGAPRPQTLEPLPPRADERLPPRADERLPPRAERRYREI